MRLLNVKTFQLETFFDTNVPEYVALSHTWNSEEVTFQDILTGAGQWKKGWNKLVRASAQAKNYGCTYIWIDTCCIDKSSSAELSEAINSMFLWYSRCKVCLAYLEDVNKDTKPLVTIVEVDSTPVPPDNSTSINTLSHV